MTVDRETRNAWLMAGDAELNQICKLDFHKSSGNGGQKVNKTSSAVRITHTPTGFSVVSAESRSQLENRKHAFSKLRLLLAFELRCEPDPAFQSGNPPVSMKNESYPLWLASLLDVVESEKGDLKNCAEKLSCGTTKLVKLFYRDSILWTRIQNIRQKNGFPPLRNP